MNKPGKAQISQSSEPKTWGMKIGTSTGLKNSTVGSNADHVAQVSVDFESVLSVSSRSLGILDRTYVCSRSLLTHISHPVL